MWRVTALLILLLAASTARALPLRLSETGYDAPGRLAFAPQYPLWSDGTSKQRWIWLPPGTRIDASDPDAWEFPPGTRLFKDFAFAGRIETRVIERRADGSWDFGVYVWNTDGSDALLAPAGGIRALAVASAPGGTYRIPSRRDCLACHAGPRVPVLGFSALQLSADRDPLAPHAERSTGVDLPWLVEHGLLRGLPPELLARAPRIRARSPAERAALGYLHGNCGHCHASHDDSDAAVPVALRLARTARETAPDPSALQLPDPDLPYRTLLPQRMRSRDPHQQMPPLGTAVPDPQGLELVERWLEEQSRPPTAEPKEQ